MMINIRISIITVNSLILLIKFYQEMNNTNYFKTLNKYQLVNSVGTIA